MRIATLLHKRAFKLVGALTVFVSFLFCLAFPSVQFLTNQAIRFVDGQHPFGGGSIHDPSHMSLPSIIVEFGQTVCCRMEFCDFRFPLPHGARLAQMESVVGSSDQIQGVIYVTNTDGAPVDLNAYARLIHRAGFRVSHVSNLLGYDSFGANSPDGGSLIVDAGQSTKITISFFGDY